MKTTGELRAALAAVSGPLVWVAVFSFAINMLLLTSPLYMMQVYDRVLLSRSEATLLMLTLIVVGLLVLMAAIDWARSGVMIRIAARFEGTMRARVFDAVHERQLRMPRGLRTQPLADLAQVRQFIGGPGLYSAFDLPWTPLMTLVMFLIHPLLGWIVLIGGTVLLVIAIANEIGTRQRLEAAGREATAGLSFAETSLRNVEATEAMGMLGMVRRRWSVRAERALAVQAGASDRAAVLTALSKLVRLLIQTALLGAGALLTIEGHITPGLIIAASILGSKAVAPIEQLVGTWSGFVAARLAWGRLDDLLTALPPRPDPMPLPAPKGRITLEGVSAVPPGGNTPTLRGVSLAIQAGEHVGVVGPSAAGKTTLARLIAGVWLPAAGRVRIDGADLQHWSRDLLGPHVGYLPQDIELFDGTVAENIARFGSVDAVAVVAAARQAGVHEMILQLPQGYDTPLGPAGDQLSGGQRQRIALARALYADPVLLVLDEPNSNLDETGEASLIEAMRQAKAAGRTVIVIAHRASVLTQMDTLIVLRDGAVAMHGPRAEVMPKLLRAASGPSQAPPLPSIASSGQSAGAGQSGPGPTGSGQSVAG
jgi:ATP-binding cassette, subfamily C, bacterial EexD